MMTVVTAPKANSNTRAPLTFSMQLKINSDGESTAVANILFIVVNYENECFATMIKAVRK